MAALAGCSRPTPSPEAASAPSGPPPVAATDPAGATGPSVAPAPASSSTGPTAPTSPAGPTGPTGTTGGLGGPTGPTGPVPATPSLPQLPVVAVEARLGAVAVPLSGPGSEPIDPASAFEVRLPLRTRGARLVLLDAQDALVPSTSESEVADARSRYTLVPLEPLRTGSRYVLRLEGVESRQVLSDDGRPHEPLAVAFLVSGEPPAKAAPPKKGQKKKPR